MVDREVTTVEVKIDTWKHLNRRREPGDTMDDVIRRALAIEEAEDGADEVVEQTPEARESPPLPDDLPSSVGRSQAAEAIDAAAEYLHTENGATMREIVREIMPDYSLGYDVPELKEGERYRGAWWRRVIRPGLELRDDVTKPKPGQSEWRPAK